MNNARRKPTEQKCPDCGEHLEITRDCHKVEMLCPHCKKTFDLRDFISKNEPAMELFLENLHLDRI